MAAAGAAANNADDKRFINYVRKAFGNPDITGRIARAIYESSNPTTQCNNIIGKFSEGTPCYICGLKINIIQKFRGTSYKISSLDGGYPECEHLLPIGEAIIWLGLYNPENKANPWYRTNILPYEYRWAHKTCNQIKSNDTYIKIVRDKSGKERFIVDQVGIQTLLHTIWNTDRSDSVDFKNTLHAAYKGDYAKFKKARMSGKADSILKPFQDICDELNKREAPRLLELAGVIASLHGPMSKIGKKLREEIDPAFMEAETKRIADEKAARGQEQYFKIVKKVEEIIMSVPSFPHDKITDDVKMEFSKEVDILKQYFIGQYMKMPRSTLPLLEKDITCVLLYKFKDIYVKKYGSRIGYSPPVCSDVKLKPEELYSQMIRNIIPAVEEVAGVADVADAANAANAAAATSTDEALEENISNIEKNALKALGMLSNVINRGYNNTRNNGVSNTHDAGTALLNLTRKKARYENLHNKNLSHENTLIANAELLRTLHDPKLSIKIYNNLINKKLTEAPSKELTARELRALQRKKRAEEAMDATLAAGNGKLSGKKSRRGVHGGGTRKLPKRTIRKHKQTRRRRR